jgi:CheY-like chemotaxis protein
MTMRALVADDDVLNRDILVRLLARLDVEARSASDGIEALALAREAGPFDLALLDLCMPRMDGFQAALALREMVSGNAKRPLIYAITGLEDDPAILEAGFDGYLQKPIATAALREILQRRENEVPK